MGVVGPLSRLCLSVSAKKKWAVLVVASRTAGAKVRGKQGMPGVAAGHTERAWGCNAGFLGVGLPCRCPDGKPAQVIVNGQQRTG